MMVYLLEGDGLKKDASQHPNRDDGQSYVCLVSFKNLGTESKYFGISEKTVFECLRGGMSKFESHDGFDFITLNILDDFDQLKEPQRICVYFSDHLLVFVCDDNPVINDMLEKLEVGGITNISLGKILYLYFDKLTFDDALILENIEQEISELEEGLMVSKKNNLTDAIVILRKKLLALKRYYEQLLEISEAIEQNENGLIHAKSLRYFKMLTNRADRLYHGVINLRDYVTQVREAYQAQIDISLNSVMKIFTVITSIFLPLTLIVGWYGMNLKMPEFSWEYGYPSVILLSILTATVSIFYFKKNGWF